MKKKSVSIFLIWTILLVSVGVCNTPAQTISKEVVKDVKSARNEIDSFNQHFDKSLISYPTNVLETPINFKEISKNKSNNTPKRQTSGKTKAKWILIGIGVAVGLFFLIKYAKECEIYESNCLPDEVCPCLKYKEEKK